MELLLKVDIDIEKKGFREFQDKFKALYYTSTKKITKDLVKFDSILKVDETKLHI